MDPASSLRKQSSSKASSKSPSNRYFDLAKIAEGLVEDVTVSATQTQAEEVTEKKMKKPKQLKQPKQAQPKQVPVQSKTVHKVKESKTQDMKSKVSQTKSSHRRSRSILEAPIVDKSTDKSTDKSVDKSTTTVSFGSLIITNETNVLLNEENAYTIRFTTGMPDGNGISINELGDTITFSESGSYRFELYGSAQPFSELDADLVYYSEKFTPEMEAFYKFKIPEVDGKLQLQNMATILPISASQTVTLKLLPSIQESIMLLSGARLLISRVA